MKVWIVGFAAILALTGRVCAAQLPDTLWEALPEQAEEFLEDGEFSTAEGFSDGLLTIWEIAGAEAGEILRRHLRGAASVLLVVVLCGAAECFPAGEKQGLTGFLPAVGALAITLLTVGDLDTLMGLGRRTVEDLGRFSRVLLPVLAAATAAAGGLSAATAQKVATVALVDGLIRLIGKVLMPLVYFYVALLTAACALPDNRLEALAGGVKKTVTWLLTTALLVFTLYLSVARVVTGAVDAASVKMAKAAISGMVPVVGGIISEAAETVLAGAGVLKNTVGIFGMLAVLASCVLPFLHAFIQYLLYKLTAFLAAVLGVPRLCRLLDGLGGAFGLVLGMTGSCALLLLVSVLSSVAAVSP